MKERTDPQGKLPADSELDIFDEWEESPGEQAPEVQAKATASDPPPAGDIEGSATEVDPLDVAADVPIQVVAVLAKKNMSMREVMDFRMGQVIDLHRPPTSYVDLVANGKLVARGELVEIDGKLGVRVVKLLR